MTRKEERRIQQILEGKLEYVKRLCSAMLESADSLKVKLEEDEKEPFPFYKSEYLHGRKDERQQLCRMILNGIK